MNSEQSKAAQVEHSIAFKVDLVFRTLKQWLFNLINEPSIGLYFIQSHLKDTIQFLRLQQRDERKHKKKLAIMNDQQEKTIEELKEIGRLNKQWANNMSTLLDKLQRL